MQSSMTPTAVHFLHYQLICLPPTSKKVSSFAKTIELPHPCRRNNSQWTLQPDTDPVRSRLSRKDRGPVCHMQASACHRHTCNTCYILVLTRVWQMFKLVSRRGARREIFPIIRSRNSWGMKLHLFEPCSLTGFFWFKSIFNCRCNSVPASIRRQRHIKHKNEKVTTERVWDVTIQRFL